MSTRLLFVSGHRTDQRDRSSPRFPESQVDRVRSEIRTVLRDWQVGPGWTLLTGGARGCDLLAAAEARALGAEIRICLAMPKEAFIERSVRTDHLKPAEDWVRLFTEVCSDAQVDLLPTRWQPRDTYGSEAFSAANDWMLSETRTDDTPHALLVWDGKEGASGCGTAQIVARLSELTDGPARCRIIDPTYRGYEEREPATGRKRILTLDGGGIRGVIALEILHRMEQQLREETGRPGLVLADFFDYIAGTSTGAVIGTGLALGKSVSDIRDQYHQLGHAAFRGSIGAWLRLARFSEKSVLRQLRAFLGEDLLLGDPRLKTLLLIVMHSTETDSPWLLSNCTKAKYNRTDRLFPQSSRDRNLDVALLPLVRASTAAPTYFPPQPIQLGDREPVLYQDGGLTAFNNPALVAAVMATLPVYGLGWHKGVDDLLVVSVGTGSSAAAARRRSTAIAQAVTNYTKIVPVFMNGAAYSQDLLCRVIGNCRYGPSLDNEVGDLVGRQFFPDDQSARVDDVSPDPGDIPAVGEFFSYVRYDADLSDIGLGDVNIPRSYWRKVRQMTAVAQIPKMVAVGEYAAEAVDVQRHFAGFLTGTTT